MLNESRDRLVNIWKLMSFVQTMNILIVNQSLIDILASFFTLMTAIVEVDGTGMSRDRLYDQFVCRVWLTRLPFWNFIISSSYNIFVTALDRYAAVIYPVWYSANVSYVFAICAEI